MVAGDEAFRRDVGVGVRLFREQRFLDYRSYEFFGFALVCLVEDETL